VIEAEVGKDDRYAPPVQKEHSAAHGEIGRRSSNSHGPGRHHRVRAMWHIDTCSSCGSIRRGGYDGYRGDVVNPRMSHYLTTRRLPATGAAGPCRGRLPVRIDVNSVVLLAGIVLLVLGPCVGWLVLS
jgi:hypothetical protein